MQDLSARMKQEMQGLHQAVTPSSTKHSDHDEINIVRAKNTSLEEELEKTRKALTKARMDMTKLHKMILNSKLDESGPTDDVVEKAFQRLSHTIFQFAMRHCANYHSRRSVYGRLPADAKSWWVVRCIANFLYKELFAVEVKQLGFAPDCDRMLAKLEQDLLDNDQVPHSDVVEWRTRTCRLSGQLEPQGHNIDPRCQQMAIEMYRNLAQYWHYPQQDLQRRSLDIRQQLGDIFGQAFRISMLFRGAKVEYKWMQSQNDMGTPPLREDEIEEVATAGYKSFSEAARAHDDWTKVFGQVVKGNGPSGRISEGSFLLRKCMVLLGPIPQHE